MSNQGFRRFDVHIGDEATRPVLDALAKDRLSSSIFGSAIDGLAPIDPSTVDPETAAKRYLRHALASSALPSFMADGLGVETSKFRSLGTESFPFTPVRAVKFRQTIGEIPVYGSLVTVEVDARNDLVSITSHLGEPGNVDPIAQIAPAQVLEIVRERSGNPDLPATTTPLLHFYYDENGARWHLAYIVQDVPYPREKTVEGLPSPVLADVVVDAHTGETIAELRRVFSVDLLEVEALDGLDVLRRFTCTDDGNGGQILHDPRLNVKTHNFGFRETINAHLPGDLVGNPPDPWDPSAVSAHTNASVVAQFLVRELNRIGIDNKGGELASTVNCKDVLRPNGFADTARNRILFGQKLLGGRLVSFAVALEVVAHEVFHAILNESARLQADRETGALSESYSDIFGIIVANFHSPSITNWNWKIGEKLFENGGSLRDLSKPGLRGRPRHMDGLDLSQSAHFNSAIHSFAAYRIMTEVDEKGALLFDPASLAHLFCTAVLKHLSMKSDFADSRVAVLQTARTNFMDVEEGLRVARLRAIERAFDDTGILAPVNA